MQLFTLDLFKSSYKKTFARYVIEINTTNFNVLSKKSCSRGIDNTQSQGDGVLKFCFPSIFKIIRRNFTHVLKEKKFETRKVKKVIL